MEIDKTKSISVLTQLPDDGQICYCFGHKTFCCKEDMEKIAKWHRVRFIFLVSSYELKKKLPEDIEDSVLESIKTFEKWFCLDGEEPKNQIVGVTHWRP